MNDNGTPVLILFIVTIGIILYNYIDSYHEANQQLRDTIEAQQYMIDKKTKQNQAMANLVTYLYRANTGRDLPSGWTEVLKEKPRTDNPVH